MTKQSEEEDIIKDNDSEKAEENKKDNTKPKKEKKAKEPKKDKNVEKIEKLEEDMKECNDKLLRTMAEFDNFRKRSLKEKDSIYPQAIVDTVEKFIPIIDSFERAIQTECNDEKYAEGIKLIFDLFMSTLKTLNVEEIAEVGVEFNPDLHNAVMHIEDENFGENQISQVLQKGYKIGDKVVRFAMVQVAN